MSLKDDNLPFENIHWCQLLKQVSHQFGKPFPEKPVRIKIVH